MDPDKDFKNSKNMEAEVTDHSTFDVSDFKTIKRLVFNNLLQMQGILDLPQESTNQPDRLQVNKFKCFNLT